MRTLCYWWIQSCTLLELINDLLTENRVLKPLIPILYVQVLKPVNVLAARPGNKRQGTAALIFINCTTVAFVSRYKGINYFYEGSLYFVNNCSLI